MSVARKRVFFFPGSNSEGIIGTGGQSSPGLLVGWYDQVFLAQPPTTKNCRFFLSALPSHMIWSKSPNIYFHGPFVLLCGVVFFLFFHRCLRNRSKLTPG